MISVVGAGPAGSFTAYLLAKSGKDVVIFEEHEKVGSPVQCTGIVTGSINKFFDLPNSVIANRCAKVRVVSNKQDIVAETDEVVMYRNKFDEFVANKAIDAGVKILTNHQFIGLNNQNSIKIKNKNNGEIKNIETELIIGADGPSSAVAKSAGLSSNPKFYIGMQAKVKHRSSLDAFETYFGQDFPNFFGWVVPESEETVRIGLGSFSNTKDLFYRFLEKVTGKKDIICWESGIIPVYNPKKIIQKDNVFLIGDAAAQVKATTGGGIIPSLKAAQTLCDCIVNKKDYNIEFRKRSGRELLLHLKIRDTLDKFSDKDYDFLLNLMSQMKVKKILKKYDRDSPIPLILNLMLREPRFLLYSRFAF